MDNAVAALEKELVAEHGGEQRAREQQGLDQVARFWLEHDGGRVDFEAFVSLHFAGDEDNVNGKYGLFEKLLEQQDGHSIEILLAFL